MRRSLNKGSYFLMKKILFMIFLLSFKILPAQESVDPDAGKDPDVVKRRMEYRINDRYKAGEYLIYDCFAKYYACVNEDSFTACKEKRSEREKLKESAYRCAPLKKFKDKKECLEANYDVIERITLQRFCYPK